MDFGSRSFVLIKCEFNKEFNKGQDRGSEILDFRFLSFVLLNFNMEFNEGQDRGLEILNFRFLSFVLIKFHKELNKGKNPDSKIQKSKNYRGAPKVLDFLDLHCVFVFLDFSKKNNVFFWFLDFRGFWFWKILKIQKNTMFFLDFLVLLKNPKNTMILLDFSIKTAEHPKITIVFFRFSRISKSKNFENPKKQQ